MTFLLHKPSFWILDLKVDDILARLFQQLISTKNINFILILSGVLHRGRGPDALIGSQSSLHPCQIQKLARILLLLISHFKLVYLFG